MDGNYYSHDEFFKKYNRPKRTPHSPNLWAKSSESQGVSCPTRLRENSLDSLGDCDRMKEVVHIPCPKRSGGAKVVASFRGKSVDEKSQKRNRGAREFKKIHAVPANPSSQWMVLSSQDRYQNPNAGRNIKPDQSVPNISYMKQFPVQSWNRGVQTLERSMMMRNSKYTKEELLPTPPADSKLKTKFQPHSLDPVQMPRLPEVQPGRYIASNQEYYRFGTTLAPYRNLQVQGPQMSNPGSKMDRPPQNPMQLLMNSYNVTIDGSHLHSPSTTANSTPHAQNEINPYYLTPMSPANPVQVYTLVFNASMPSTVFPTESRNGPWVPGSLEVDIPPGSQHQPTLPKFTTKSFDAVDFQDLPKAQERNLELNNQPFPNGPPHNWKYVGPSQNYQNYPVAEPFPASSYPNHNPGGSPFAEKTTHAFKNVFGKSKKEEAKLKSAKPSKPLVSYAHHRGAPRMDKQWSSGTVKQFRPAPLFQQEPRTRLEHSMNHSMAQAGLEGKSQHSLAPVKQPGELKANGKGYPGSNSGNSAYILNPPVTMDPSLFTNKAYKIASKVDSIGEVTYTPFKGHPPARNDEESYDKHMRFMGKIDRPPLVNIKKHKWAKFNRKFTDDAQLKGFDNLPVGFYSEPVDFHSDGIADSESDAARHRHRSRHCHHDGRAPRLTHGRA